MTTHGYCGMNYDRQVENTNTSTLHKMKETYWTTKQAVMQKLGKKEDEHVVASDQELDSKLDVFRAIQRSSMELLRVVERYQDRLCVVSQEENAMGRFLKTNSSHDKTRAGKMMAAVGKSQSFAAQQRLALRVPLVRLYQEVETFRYRAVSDTLVTINRMEGARTEYRGALLWMKNVSEELDPDTFKQLEKFRKVQGQVRKTKGRFDKLKLDVMQKVDLLAASRCNMFSHVLANYQSTLLHFWEKTSRTMSAVAESFKGYQHYEFNMLKELTEPSKEPMKDGEDQVANLDFESEMLLALGEEDDEDEKINTEENFKNQVIKGFAGERIYKNDNMERSSDFQPFIEFERENPSLLPQVNQDSSRGWKIQDDDMLAHVDNLDLLTENYEENDTDKDDMTLLNEILNAPSTGEDEFTQEWQAVFGSSPMQASPALLSTEADTGRVFMPSSLLDIAAPKPGKNTGQDLNMKPVSVIVIGATNRPDSLDPALRRAGRFDREISLGIPDETARMRILQVLCRELRLCENFDYKHLAHNSPGFVGADLMALAREAAMTAVNRVFQKLQNPSSSSDETHPPPVSYDETHLPSVSSDEIDPPPVSVVEKSPSQSEPTTSVKSTSPGTIISQSSSLSSVLSWLRDQPPLTEQQLQDLYITMEDFQEALKHVQPSAKREGFATIPDVTWSDIGALHVVREELQLAILAPVRHQQEFESLGLTNPPGILLAGPPGCGKTLLAKAIANESGINFISVKGPELLNMYVGESERAVRQVFQRARNSSPCVIFFDELDALCPKRTGSGEGGASVRVVNQMLTEMDGLESRKKVFIMAATNRPDIIDPAILRPGRLDKLLYVGLPTPEDRLDILNTVTKKGTKPCLSEDVSLTDVSADSRCEGFSGADLASLVREASVTALKDVISKPSTERSLVIKVSACHFETAFSKVKPSVTKKDQEKYGKMQGSFRS